jgi:putative oxidoreductase
MEKKQDVGLLMIRVIIALPMLIYGLSKLNNGIDFIKSLLQDNGLPTFFSYGVYVGEIIAPILIIAGYRTRLAALLFAFNCLTAILLTQTSLVFKLNQNGGWAIELLAIYMVVSFGLYFTGAGKIAVSNKALLD